MSEPIKNIRPHGVIFSRIRCGLPITEAEDIYARKWIKAAREKNDRLWNTMIILASGGILISLVVRCLQ